PDGRPRKASRDAGHARAHGQLALVRWRTKNGRKIFLANSNWSGLSFGNVHGRMPKRLADLAFEVSNPGLAGVILDDLPQRFVGNIDLPWPNSVCLHLPRHQVTPCNLKLFVRGVASETDNLHTITQRPRYRVKDIRCRDKHDPAEVERHAEIIISEDVVLL